MKQVKRLLGLLWIVIAAVSIVALLLGAYQNIDTAGTTDISKPLPWIIIIAIFTPIAVGMGVFGWYAFKGEYEENMEPGTNK
ncbi:MAG: DUF6814 family protein [Chitinophagaceae bacterium]